MKTCLPALFLCAASVHFQGWSAEPFTGANGSGVVYDTTWQNGDVLRYRHQLYLNGYSSGSVWTGRGSKGGGGIVPTNAVLSVLKLLDQLPPSDSRASPARQISIGWGPVTNRQHRTYDRANPPRELLEIHVASEAEFDQPVALLKAQHEHDFTGKYAAMVGAGADIILVGRERVSAWNWKTGKQLFRVEEQPETYYMDGEIPVRLSAARAGMFVCARSQKVSLHDLASGRELWSHFEPERYRGEEFIGRLWPDPVCLAPDGNVILVAKQNQLRRFQSRAAPQAGRHGVNYLSAAARWSVHGFLARQPMAGGVGLVSLGSPHL